MTDRPTWWHTGPFQNGQKCETCYYAKLLCTGNSIHVYKAGKYFQWDYKNQCMDSFTTVNEQSRWFLYDPLNLVFCGCLISSSGVDSHSCTDCGGYRDRLLLHNRTADPGSYSLLHPGLAAVNFGCRLTLLCLLPLLMVRSATLNFKTRTKKKKLIMQILFCTGGFLNLPDG